MKTAMRGLFPEGDLELRDDYICPWGWCPKPIFGYITMLIKRRLNYPVCLGGISNSF